jgi:hypothetical protein
VYGSRARHHVHYILFIVHSGGCYERYDMILYGVVYRYPPRQRWVGFYIMATLLIFISDGIRRTYLSNISN